MPAGPEKLTEKPAYLCLYSLWFCTLAIRWRVDVLEASGWGDHTGPRT